MSGTQTPPPSDPSSDPDAGSAATAESVVSADRVFALLEDPRNRHIVHFLREQDGRVSVREVAVHVADQHSRNILDATPLDPDRVAQELTTRDLPELDDADIVDYDPGDDTVVKTDRVEYRPQTGDLHVRP